MNKVILTGRITRDPDIKYANTGTAYLSFSIAVDRQMRDAAGNRQADFFNCTAFRTQAEFMQKYVKKGNLLLVEGKLQTNNYQAQDGTYRTSVSIMCDHVENLSPREAQELVGQQANRVQPQTPYQQPTQIEDNYQMPSYQDDNTLSVDDEDLPF